MKKLLVFDGLLIFLAVRHGDSFADLIIQDGVKTASSAITVSGMTTINGGSLAASTSFSELGNPVMTAGTLTHVRKIVVIKK